MKYLVWRMPGVLVAIPALEDEDGVEESQLNSEVDEYFEGPAALMSRESDAGTWSVWVQDPRCGHNPFALPPCAHWQALHRRVDMAVHECSRSLK